MHPVDWLGTMKKINDIRKRIVGPDSTILEVLSILNQPASKVVYVLGNKNVLLGTITDGDVRRGLLKGLSSTALSKDIMNTSPSVASPSTSHGERADLLRGKTFSQLPIVDDDRILLGVIEADDPNCAAALNNTAVIMCGGLGKRMGKLTSSIPKPMLQVGDKPILQQIIENLIVNGITRVYLAINYLGKIIESHFGNGRAFGIEIEYLRETKRMGTAGALSLLPEIIDRPLLVMNGDIVTHFNVAKLFDFHFSSRSVATMAIARHQYQNPYGVVRFDGHKFLYIDEKPITTYYINAGIYILSPEALFLTPKGEYMDMPALFLATQEKKLPVSVCPICEYWTDVGRESDYVSVLSDFAKAET